MPSIPEKIASLPGIKHIPWGAPLRLIPKPLQLFAAGTVANHVLAESLAAGDLDFLQGQSLRLHISDLGYDWHISKRGNSLVFSNPDGRAAASISGHSRDLLLMAGRREDADTLFFQRRLLMEGDTELGLMVKNQIDGIDLEELPKLFNRALSLGADFAEAFQPH
jgi:predicted lipid carrier protein YhbT